MRKLVLMGFSIVNLCEVDTPFVMVDFVMEMLSKKSCNFGEYGSFYHGLFLYLYTTLPS